MKTKETANSRVVAAPCDIFEENGRIILRIDMPGVTKEGLSVHIEDDELRIEGKRLREDVKGTYLIREIPDCDFAQAYTLDSTIDKNAIQAVLENGQLLVTLSIKESEKPRTIAVTARG